MPVNSRLNFLPKISTLRLNVFIHINLHKQQATGNTTWIGKMYSVQENLINMVFQLTHGYCKLPLRTTEVHVNKILL